MKRSSFVFISFYLLVVFMAGAIGVFAQSDQSQGRKGQPNEGDPAGRKFLAYEDGKRPDAPFPRPGVSLKKGQFAVLITDPQNDFLSEKGVTWGVVGESVVKNRTRENIESLFKTAKANDVPVFVSPHYYYKHDHQWRFEGALEKLMHSIGMFDRKGPLSLDGFSGSGADWLDRYKPYIEDGKTVVTSPHKVYGPETNDLVLQLRKAGISQVILGGMSANLCTESHMRELLEQGFEVLIASDATAAAKVPHYDGYEAAFINFRFMANDVLSTVEIVEKIKKGN